MKSELEGILLIDKSEGETSYDVIRKIKGTFKRKTISKIGHAGTLDPFATGLLIVLLGQGTKLSRFIMSLDKVYSGVLKLGIETDTLDPTGEVIQRVSVPALSVEKVQDAAAKLVGRVEQRPPMYSAVKYKGKRAYTMARKGVHVDLEKRSVRIDALEIVSVKNSEVTFEVACSGGTYVRTLASDLSKGLGTVGHLKSLRRLAIGPFQAEKALASNMVLKGNESKALVEKVIPLIDALPGMPGIEADAALKEKIQNGYQPVWEDFPNNTLPAEHNHVKIVYAGKLVAIIKSSKKRGVSHGRLEIERVFK
jgi:tRNA pseudouridine55 synthase